MLIITSDGSSGDANSHSLGRETQAQTQESPCRNRSPSADGKPCTRDLEISRTAKSGSDLPLRSLGDRDKYPDSLTLRPKEATHFLTREGEAESSERAMPGLCCPLWTPSGPMPYQSV